MVFCVMSTISLTFFEYLEAELKGTGRSGRDDIVSPFQAFVFFASR